MKNNDTQIEYENDYCFVISKSALFVFTVMMYLLKNIIEGLYRRFSNILKLKFGFLLVRM